MSEVFDSELFETKLRRLASSYARQYGDLLQYDVEDELSRFKEYRSKLVNYAVDAVEFIKDAQDKNVRILIEGANALMLDIDYGTVSIWNSLIVCFVVWLASLIGTISEICFQIRVQSETWRTNH